MLFRKAANKIFPTSDVGHQNPSAPIAKSLNERHRPEIPLRVRIDNVPEFDYDLGEEKNVWHRAQERSPSIEPLETQIFVRLLSDNPRVLDIGANIGWYSCIASAVSRGRAQIIAFEPEPANFTLLARNAALNFFHGIRAMQTALGAENGRGKLYLNDENAGDHRIMAVDDRPSISIAIAKLDSVLEGTGFVPDLIKTDVQGAEPLVYAGGEKTFAEAGASGAILTEFYPGGMGMKAAHEQADRLFAFGRSIYALYPYEGGQLQRLSRDRLHEAIEGCLHAKFDKYIDILVAPGDDRMDRLRDMIGRDWEQWRYDTA